MAREFSTKRLAIDKAYATLVVAMAVAAFIVVFSLVASKALLDQRGYQSKVISKKETARDTLEANIAAADQLNIAYTEFINAPTNAIGGNPRGDGSRDGDNARIILDALPSKYDFPGLATSINKLFKDNGFVVTSIDGIDDEVVQAAAALSESPQPVEIPFKIEISSAAPKGKTLMELFERSIRPFQIQSMTISGDDNSLDFSVEANTYFQPAKSLELKKEVVK